MDTLVISPFIFGLGLAMGSFANVIIHRLPCRLLSITYPPSSCPNCNVYIKPYDNIPLISYIFLKGKCRNCGYKIPFRYPAVELLTALLFLALYYRFLLGLLFWFFSAFTFIMIVHAFIDFKHYLLLDKLNVVATIIGITGLIFIPSLNLINGIMGAFIGGGLLLLVYLLIKVMFRKEGMGVGDIKTAAVIGLFLGPLGVVFMFIIASVLGIIWGVIRMLAGKGRMLPFGTTMAPAAIMVIFFEEMLYNLIYL